LSRESNKLVDKAIREILAPVLRADGFKGSGRTFRRYRGELVHVFSVLGSRWGGALYAGLGVHLRFLVFPQDLPWTWEKISEHNCFLRSALAPGGWRHEEDEASIFAAIQSIRTLYESHGRAEFDRFSQFPESFKGIPSDTSMVDPPVLTQFVAAGARFVFPTLQLHLAKLKEAPEPPRDR
jgi:hypothetical protein